MEVQYAKCTNLIKMLPHLNAVVAKHYLQQKNVMPWQLMSVLILKTYLRRIHRHQINLSLLQPSLYTTHYEETLAKCNLVIHLQIAKHS